MDYYNFLGPVSPLKETKATTKEGPSLLVEVQAKLYYGLKTMVRNIYKNHNDRELQLRKL